MKCPYCAEEMEKGIIPNECHPYWLPKGKMMPPIRHVVPKAAVRLALDETTMMWQKATAYYCPNCKIVIAKTQQ